MGGLAEGVSWQDTLGCSIMHDCGSMLSAEDFFLSQSKAM